MMNRLLILIVFLCLLVPQGATAADETGRLSCHVCGMYLDQFHDTSCELERKDGKRYGTCGVACMIRLVNDEGGPDAFTSIMVHAWDTKELLSAQEASYVIGSRVIPDMIPNVIAFSSREAAQEFVSKEGGDIVDFTQALLSISPMGMTMPTRIKTAVLPPRGSFGIGAGYMYMKMDKVKEGSNTVDPDDFVKRPGQMMGPKKMEVSGEMLMGSYGITDDLTVGMNLSYLDKEMEMYTMGGRATQTTDNSGFGDIGVNLRYNVWRNVYYSKFFSLLVETTIPTGDFDETYVSSPGLQIGTGAFSFTGGALFSHRAGNFWFHYMTSYTVNLENGDDYQYGDLARLGGAVHYTPNYNLMAGLEADANWAAKNEYEGKTVDNTGGFRSTISGVVDWKFLTALGGNFSVRLTAGVPLYEDLNHYRMGTMERVQLGGGYFANVMLNFKRRFPVH